MSAGTGIIEPSGIAIVDMMNGFVARICRAAAWLNVVVIATIIAQVTMRYGFNQGLVYLEELIWHFYAVAFMFGIAYCITNDTHIRVDLVHMSLSPRKQHVIEIIGILVLLLPFLVIIIDQSIEWVAGSYKYDEGSSSPQGLPNRWIIKSFLPLSFILMLIATIARLIHQTMLLFGHGREVPVHISGLDPDLEEKFHIAEHVEEELNPDAYKIHHEENKADREEKR